MLILELLLICYVVNIQKLNIANNKLINRNLTVINKESILQLQNHCILVLNSGPYRPKGIYLQ